MLHLNELENLKINVGPIFIPKKKNKKGLLLFFNNTNQFISFLNNVNIKNKFQINSYFMEYLYNLKIFNSVIKEKITTDEIYKSIKNNSKIITKTFRNIGLYNGSNVYIDLQKYNELFNSHMGKRKGTMATKAYLNLLNTLIEKYCTNYDEKYLILDLQFCTHNLKSSDTYNLSQASEEIQFIYNLMTRNIEGFKALDINFLFINGKKSFIIKPSECNETSANLFRKNLMSFKIVNDNIEENIKITKKEHKKEIIKDEIKSSILKGNFTKFNFNGKRLDEELEDKVDKTVDDLVEELDDTDNDIEAEYIKKEIEERTKEKLNEDKDFLSKLQLVTNDSFTNNSKASTKRNMMLAEKQSKLKINNKGKSIDEILKNADDKKLIPMHLKINTLNTDMKDMVLPNFTKSYNKKLLEKDTIAILNFFKNKKNPVYILDIKKEDTSNAFDKKYTYTVKMESADRTRHNLVFDLPKFVDDSFLFLGGNKKNIISQLVLKPVSKTAYDTVQFCSCYNKIFMKRMGNKISPKLERLKKAILLHNGTSPRAKLYVRTGDNSTININYKTVIEYDELAKNFMNISIDGGRINFYLNQNYIRDYIKKNNLEFKEDDNILPVGIENNKKIIYLDTEKNTIVGSDLEFADYVISKINETINGFKEEIGDLSSGKKFMYTTCTIMAKKVPTILLLAYLEGLTTVLKKAEIKCEFSDKRKKLETEDKLDKGCIEFADGFLYFDRYPFRNSLLLNALALIPTKEYNYTDFDGKEVYLSLFEEMYNSGMILNAFENFYELFIDPITLEVLEDLNLPTDFVNLLLYGNSLLEDNQFIKENNMSLYRLRNNEMVNVVLYQNLADAYSRYRTTVGNKHPEKMTIPRDAVIKDLVMLKNVEDFSTLNPILEAEKLRAVSYKGPSGMNLEMAYTLEKRAYDKSMRGILAMSSPNSGTVGMIRQMAMDANILSPRGYLKIADGNEDLNSSNVFCPSELLTPFCAQSDDAPRVAMVTAQSKHIVPCRGYQSLLITNGADKAIGSVISNEYVFKAREDGKVLEINDESKIAVLKYKSGKVDIIDYGKRITKNGGGGFYNVYELDLGCKAGDTFKEGDILAVNRKFFDPISRNESIYKVGVLSTVALMSGYYTYEDSDAISKRLSDELGTDVAANERIVLGKNSNVEFVAKKGDYVEVGDPLVIFDESYSDDSINKLLANLSDKNKEAFNNLSNRPIKAKHAGTIEDIKIYYTVDMDQLSPSLQKTIKNINKDLIKKRKVIEKYEKLENTDIILPPTEKVEAKYGKVKGEDVGEGVMIEFTINRNVGAGTGDKIIVMNALKSVICKKMEEGKEPLAEFTNWQIDIFLSGLSFLGRMTGSILKNGFANKELVYAKEIWRKMYNDEI